MPTINGKACVANGRNLISSSSEFDRYWSIPSQATIVAGYNGHKAIHADIATWTSGYIDVQQPIYNADVQLIKPGEWYTISFYAKGTGTIRTHIYPSVVDSGAGQYVDGVFRDGWVSGDGMHEWILTDEYVRHSWSFKTKTPLSPTTNYGKMLFRIYYGSSAYASLPKLEQGTTATPWTPAPVDKVFSNGKQVYGRNLLPSTRDFSGINIQGDKVAVTNSQGQFQAATGTSPSAGEINYDIIYFWKLPLEKDTDYTASFWVKTSENTDIVSYLYDSGSNGNYADGSTVNQATTDYTRFVVHFHNGNNTATPNFIPVRIRKPGVTVWVYGCMLEEGTTATPWTPAPEDVI